ncbi:amidohydrolase family protein [Solitalea canadensis]|uniref:Amidohydrolase, imidazolonepropionase n=1 Tax=Solitalea canadensis (strain ATCC 29591 / DSM 3403 / JCM 21819 / LMG 8368 / NBRC 15130 / NCIMB 12057 / USAM 9D) TaxID=929556 RepID=H8KXA7_SOLCM|nr:amidohydrolase family protein [Solitalea canadensis]AFD08436.1 amidohydrolase, imidazolonepropionase [Solitalea canadensis DSM 3403]
MKKVFLSIISSIALIGVVNAQTPTPAPAQSKPVAIMGAIAHIGNGTVINNSLIVFDKGKLTIVADATTVKFDLTNATVINAGGKHVYPGIIAPNTTLGLVEVEAVRSTNDDAEVGNINPNVRSLVSYNTDSDVPATVRSNGVLLAQVVPQGGLISGTSSVVQLDAWNWEDAAYAADNVVHLNWPSMTNFNSPFAPPAEQQKEQREKNLQLLNSYFKQAKAYAEVASYSVKNPKFESMRGLFTGSKRLFISANSAKEIIAATNFAKSYGISPVIVGASDAYLLLSFLKENDVQVLVQRVHSLPGREDNDVDQPYKLAKQLDEAGILYGLSMDGFWQQRNLPFMAGTTVAYGVDREKALSSVTLNTARILGIDKSTGSLEVGKDANLLITSGDLLDMKESVTDEAYIQGRKINLTNKQKQLMQKFADKYSLK